MNEKFEIVDASDPKFKAIFSNLVELYLYQLSKDLEFDVNEEGKYGDDDVVDCWDGKWTDKEFRRPFLLNVGGKWAGFAIVDKLEHFDGKIGFEIGEFFVIQKYSGQGYGKELAFYLFDTFKGDWQVRELEKNMTGIAFWRHIIAKYTKNSFTEVYIDDKRWKGPVQYFCNL